MSTKRCLYCNTPLDWEKHGNRDYCNDNCYYANKQFKNLQKYWNNKAEQDAFQKVDLILKRFYDLYGPGKGIPAILLDDVGMNWLIRKNEIIIDDRPAITIGLYAYNLYNTAIVEIWKI